ncbi:hypothetical protein FNV43_RR20118 [Rhamnella rubrinervis]|uniref:Uncharacterized protein n=1 Tax=Rhamnella rubrinervis TaxID=2594499 RepID=A0A8K0GWS7_9ROSA|nr:hypothetical protein FNV43_RR20118 [Rhamnella rubrinervis]
MIDVLKMALVQALVTNYPFAGEVVTNSTGEPELLCNNHGVDFIEAFADIELKHLNLYEAENSIHGKLVPKKKLGHVLAVQATELKCGGLVLGCTVDHRVADAYSTNMFLVSLAEIAQYQTLKSIRPCFRRSLLSPRRPGIIDPSVDDCFIPLNMLPPPPPASEIPGDDDDHHLVSRIYCISAEQVNRIQSEANMDKVNGKRRSKLVSFSAFLWKTIAKSASDGKKQCKLGILVDGRTRLGDGGDDKSTTSMRCYFGNVLSLPYGSKPAEELIEKPLCLIADGVVELLDVATRKEHFLGLIDWAEARRPGTSMAKIYSEGGSKEDGPVCVVSSGERFPISEGVDFGWGKPAFWSYCFDWRGDTGYVMPMQSPTGNGDWVVYMRLFKSQLEFLEFEAAHVFSPLITFDFL